MGRLHFFTSNVEMLMPNFPCVACRCDLCVQYGLSEGAAMMSGPIFPMVQLFAQSRRHPGSLANYLRRTSSPHRLCLQGTFRLFMQICRTLWPLVRVILTMRREHQHWDSMLALVRTLTVWLVLGLEIILLPRGDDPGRFGGSQAHGPLRTWAHTCASCPEVEFCVRRTLSFLAATAASYLIGASYFIYPSLTFFILKMGS